jgi:hypothetical protein
VCERICRRYTFTFSTLDLWAGKLKPQI